MTITRDLSYYGGNANNKRYIEGLAAQKAAAALPGPSPTLAQSLATAQALLSELEADEALSASETTAMPLRPTDPPAWKAKA